MIHHIPGKQNVADGLSRFMALFRHPITNDEAVGGVVLRLIQSQN